MDTILVNSQIADSLHTVATIHDSIVAAAPDTLVVVQHSARATTFWGMSYELASIVVPTVVTILVFVLGYVIDALIKHIKAKRETEEFRKSIFDWFGLMKLSLLTLQENLAEFVLRIQENKTLSNPWLSYRPSMIDKLDVATPENLLKYFVFNSVAIGEDKRSVKVYSIISAIERIKYTEHLVLRDFEEYRKASSELGIDWNACNANMVRLPVRQVERWQHPGNSHYQRDSESLSDCKLQGCKLWWQHRAWWRG